MNHHEQWISWQPLEGMHGVYHLDDFYDNPHCFRLMLYGDQDDRKIEVLFPRGVLAYRWTDESFRLVSIYDTHKRSDAMEYNPWPFIKVEHSSYIQELTQAAEEEIDTAPLKHFLFIDEDQLVDVIALDEPQIRFVDNKL